MGLLPPDFRKSERETRPAPVVKSPAHSCDRDLPLADLALLGHVIARCDVDDNTVGGCQVACAIIA
jgi:hypothetical protein